MPNPALLKSSPPRPSADFRPIPAEGQAPARLATAPRWIAAAIGLGMAAGLLQWIVLILHHSLVGTISMRATRVNHHVFWMAGAADLAIFAALGILCAGASRLLGPKASRPLLAGLIGLAAFSPLARLEQLHPGASLVLALGVGVALAPKLENLARSRLAKPAGAALTMAWAAGMIAGALADPVAPRFSPAGPPPAAGAKKPPNLILIVWDTVRADHLGLYGYERPTTPFLDDLARRGLTYREARATAPWTLPSHASMFTGLLPHEASASVNIPLDPSRRTIAEALNGAGYATGGIVGNLVYCNSWFGLAKGFEHYEDIVENRAITVKEALRSSGIGRQAVLLSAKAGAIANDGEVGDGKAGDVVTAKALDWIGQPLAEDRPFFLFLNYIDAHGPYFGVPGMPRPFSKLPEAEYRAKASKAFGAIFNPHLPGNALTRDEAIALIRDSYDDCIRALDDQLRALYEGLERRGLLEETWVVVTADHGEHFGEHDLFMHGNSLHRPLVHVPLVVIPPRRSATPPGAIDAPVSLADLPATFAGLAGIEGGGPFPGGSLLRYGPDSGATGSPVYSELNAAGGAGNKAGGGSKKKSLRSVLDSGRVLISRSDGAEQLFDLADTAEADNLGGDPGEAGRLEMLRGLIQGRFPALPDSH